MSALTFEKSELSNLEYSLQREMLATDRIGGYMSTTIVCCNTRRYHGLIVAPIDESDTTYVSDTVTTDELPYEYLDLYYGEDTRTGTYRDTVTAEAGDGGECRTVIVHTLTVESTTWWGSAESNRGLVIAPNPVEVGGTVTLGIELTAAERTGASVSVYSTAGAMVKSMAVPEDGDITMTCWFSPGVYMVRLTTGTGVQYHGKVIVR